ncbi:MAG TPA: ACT domain-containing protein, partial [Anaerolineae bacterium]
LTHALTLSVLRDTLAISRLDASTPIPPWADNFFSITRTRDELSIVCPERSVPAGIQCERG